jgi:molybdopterin converting factor small subunit
MARQLRVELTFLGSLQQVAGRNTMWLEVPPQGTVARVLALLRERQPQFVGVEMRCLVNGAPASPQRPLVAGDGLYLLPPDAAT